MQNPSYTYDEYSREYLICIGLGPSILAYRPSYAKIRRTVVRHIQVHLYLLSFSRLHLSVYSHAAVTGHLRCGPRSSEGRSSLGAETQRPYIHSAALHLDKHNLIKYDKKSGNFQVRQQQPHVRELNLCTEWQVVITLIGYHFKRGTGTGIVSKSSVSYCSISKWVSIDGALRNNFGTRTAADACTLLIYKNQSCIIAHSYENT